MLKKFKVTYTALKNKQREIEIMATSKYDAKQKFYLRYPKYQIVHIEEVEG